MTHYSNDCWFCSTPGLDEIPLVTLKGVIQFEKATEFYFLPLNICFGLVCSEKVEFGCRLSWIVKLLHIYSVGGVANHGR